MARVIVSRKGFDASAGGHPSPILPDGRLLSLPIPERGSGVRYADLAAGDGRSYLDVMRSAGISSLAAEGGRRPLTARTEAHLDPDLHAAVRPRLDGWRAAFGQAGAAQTVLARAGVGPGDLFLFFGWFRAPATGRPAARGPDLHVVWGWLRVGTVVDPGRAAPALASHPHVVRRDRSNNTLYVAAEEAFGGVAGAGVLPFSPARVLTSPDARGRAQWTLPACLHPANAEILPRHRARFGPIVDGTAGFDARYRWQEFVAAGPGVEAWAETMLREGHG